MASSITIPERDFLVGSPLAGEVNSFPVGIEKIRISFTRPGWPATGNVVQFQINWSDGTGLGVVYSNGPEKSAFLQIGVPWERDPTGGPLSRRRRSVLSASFSVTPLQDFRSAITVEAL